MKRPYWHTIELDGEDVKSFEKALLNWANFKVKWYPNSVLVFNHKYIVANDPKANFGPNKRACNMALDEIAIKYLRVTKSMCIMLEAIYKGKQLYKIPEIWDNSDFWIFVLKQGEDYGS